MSSDFRRFFSQLLNNGDDCSSWPSNTYKHMCKEYFQPANGLTLFVTQSGFMGIGRQEVAKSDDVVIFCGGNVPYVVRRVNANIKRLRRQRFEMVGECYIESLMHGEVEELERTGKTHLEELDLV
jgi:hypothetical protein